MSSEHLVDCVNPVIQAMKNNDLVYIKSLHGMSKYADFVHMDDTQSQQMLDLIIDRFPYLWCQENMVKTYLSKHRDYAFKRLADNTTMTTDSLLDEMMRDYDNDNSLAVDTFYEMLKDVTDIDEKSDRFMFMQREYVKYLGNVYKMMTGHYPSINDIRRHVVKVDIVLSLWDDMTYNTGKKRKL